MASDDSPSSMLARSLHLNQEEDSGDEIVWNVSEKSLSPVSSDNENSVSWEDDFVLLSRPHSPSGPAIISELSNPIDTETNGGLHTPVSAPIARQDRFQTPNLAPTSSSGEKKKVNRGTGSLETKSLTSRSTKQGNEKKKKKATKKKALRNVEDVYPSPEPSPLVSKTRKFKPLPTQITLHGRETEWFEEMAIVNFTGLGERSVVDDYSDRQSVTSCDTESVAYPTVYEEASTFISSFLSNPDAKNDTVCRLTLLQSLIIELGLATPSLPESLTAAKAFLKSRAFLNIREYLAVRGQGPEAVQRVLYPSKNALIKDIKKRRNRVSLKWVKQHGLQVLLVGWTHR